MQNHTNLLPPPYAIPAESATYPPCASVSSVFSVFSVVKTRIPAESATAIPLAASESQFPAESATDPSLFRLSALCIESPSVLLRELRVLRSLSVLPPYPKEVSHP